MADEESEFTMADAKDFVSVYSDGSGAEYIAVDVQLPSKKVMMSPSHIIDRKLIRLVRERKLLYARNTMSVGNYHAKAAQMWQEIARAMRWTVADVKRKWSHIRNSYSRHLRNELNGARTIKGRMVTKWYLADDLNFLREHMATDLRSLSGLKTTYQSPTSVEDAYEIQEVQEHENSESVTLLPSTANWSFTTSPLFDTSSTVNSDDVSSVDFRPEANENSSYYTFFKGIHEEYQQLSAQGRRIFKRKCLSVLHTLLDEEEQQRSAAEVVIEEATSGLDDPIIKNEFVDSETREATESILSDMVETTVEIVDAGEL